MVPLPHDEALALIAAEIGARERQDSLKGILESIEQSYGDVRLYPNVETRAAHLLYFIVRGHALLDGTTRGAVILFDEYLDRNGHPTLGRQLLGQLVQEIEIADATESRRAHQERMTAKIIDALTAARVPPQTE
jgi:prophage maintenance system killer protein